MFRSIRFYLVVTLVTLTLGQYDRPKRLLNANTTAIENRPYQVSLLANETYLCGGAILSPRWILTAGHCIRGYDNIEVRVGSNYSYKEGEVFITQKIHIIPYYNHDRMDYDIGLLDLLPNRIQLNTTSKKAIKMIKPGDTIASGTNVTISGYGVIDNNATISPNGLRVIESTILDLEECRLFYRYLPIRNLCLVTGTQKTCRGDSGGPVVSNTDGKLIGIVSHGHKDPGMSCDSLEFPSVLTSLAYPGIRNWIKNVTRK